MANVEQMIINDKGTTNDTIVEARSRGLRTINIFPKSEVPTEIVYLCIEKINPGERICVFLPEAFLRFEDDAIEEIQDEFRGPHIPQDIFIIMRFGEANVHMMDIYRLPSDQ